MELTNPHKILTSMHRNIDVQTAYMEHIGKKNARQDTSCDMCRLITEKPLTIKLNIVDDETYTLPSFTNVCLIENEFPYENTDGRRVILHHMLVPRKHHSKSSQLSDETRAEYYDTLDTLLSTGTYDSSYTRSTYSPTSSAPLHLHTHLFKFGSKVTKQLFDPSNDVNEIVFEDS